MEARTLLVVALVALQPITGLGSAQRVVSPTEERAGWLDAARAMPPGITVKVELKSGRRITGTLMSVTDEGLFIKEKARAPKAALMIPIADVARLERAEKNGGSMGKAIAAGAAAGVGGFLTFLAFVLMLTD
jgi:hypothetical protein